MRVLCLNRLSCELEAVEPFRGQFDVLEVPVHDRALTLEDQQKLFEINIPILLRCLTETALEGVWEIDPFMVDLPWRVGFQAIERAREVFPKALIQGSSHEEGDVEGLFWMIKAKGFDAIKIAKRAPRQSDVLELFHCLQSHAGGERLTCVPVGEEAWLGRLVAPLFGSFLSFCCLPGLPTAPGQLDVATLHKYGVICRQ